MPTETDTVDCDDSVGCPADACVPSADSPCACTGAACPPEGTYGDPLERLATRQGPSETVGVAMTDGYAISCGGFGLNVFRIATSPPALSRTGSALERCQNITPGPLVNGGDARVLYVTNHGDAFARTPALSVLLLDLATGAVQVRDTLALPGLSPEGTTYDPAAADGAVGALWLALHDAGLRRFAVAADGALSPEGDVTGLTNAYRLAHTSALILVADGDAGLAVVDARAGAVMGRVDTGGFAKDVALAGRLAFVASSSAGVSAVDLTDPAAPRLVRTIYTYGSAMAVAPFADGRRLAVANLETMVVIDTSSADALRILDVDRGTDNPTTPRNLGVATRGDLVLSGEWLGLSLLRWHDGRIAPELHLDRSALRVGGLAPGQSVAERVAVTNLGWLPLAIEEISIAGTRDWSASPAQLTIAPQATKAVVVTFAPSSSAPADATLVLASNDPDEPTVRLTLSGNPAGNNRLAVGQTITHAWDFLDVNAPEGSRKIEHLRGHPLVLVYFATF